MSDVSSDGQKLAFDREKWADELKLRQRELELKAVEADVKSKEQERQSEQLRFTQTEAQRNRWTNPLVVAVFAAAVAAGGNAIVALVNGNEQHTTEQIKADQSLILESIKANNDPDRAAANLRFLAETALISNPARRSEIITFLNRRKPGEGPALPSSNSAPQHPLSGAELLQQAKASMGLITVLSNDNGNPEQSVGTCFVVNDEGYALTAAHLFPVGRPGIRATVSLGSAFSPAYPAELVRVDQDLALIRIRGVPSFAPIKLAQTRIRVAQSVFIMGFPASSDIALLQGNVSSTDQARGGIGIIAATSPGMSGSPVFNDAGEVEAVVNGRNADTGMTIAYPIQLGAPLLLSVGISR